MLGIIEVLDGVERETAAGTSGVDRQMLRGKKLANSIFNHAAKHGGHRLDDARAMSQTIGWEPKVALRDGLKETIAYFRQILAA